eukprot:6176802-Pleurochrysis_carterae.AAC.2
MGSDFEPQRRCDSSGDRIVAMDGVACRGRLEDTVAGQRNGPHVVRHAHVPAAIPGTCAVP